MVGSVYGKPNRTILLSNVACTGSESAIDVCDSLELSPDEGRDLFPRVNVAGVKCSPDVTADPLSQVVSQNTAVIGLGIVGVLLTVSILVMLRLVLYYNSRVSTSVMCNNVMFLLHLYSLVLFVVIKRQQVKKAQAFIHEPRVLMSGLGDRSGVENPLAAVDEDIGEGEIYNTADRDELVKRLHDDPLY